MGENVIRVYAFDCSTVFIADKQAAIYKIKLPVVVKAKVLLCIKDVLAGRIFFKLERHGQ